MQLSSPDIGKRANPRSKANFLSTLTFWWTWEIFRKGNKGPILETDLYAPLNDHKSSILGDKAEKLWKSELERNPLKPSLYRFFFKFFGLRMLFYSLIQLIAEGFNMAQPMFLGKLIRYFTPGSDVDRNDAFLYAGGVVLCSILGVGFLHFFFYNASHLGMKMRIMICSLIYRKCLRLNLVRAEDEMGRVMTLMSVDATRFEFLFSTAHNLWLGPVQAVVVGFLLWSHVGLSSLTGLLYLVLCIPLYRYLGQKTSTLRPKIASKTQERIKLTQEVTDGMKTIKTNAWEGDFNNLVNEVRRSEISLIRVMLRLQAVSLSFGIFSTRLAVFISVLTIYLLQHQITAEKVFVTAAYYYILRRTLTHLISTAIRQLSEAQVSVDRMKSFLLIEETPVPRTKVREDFKLSEEMVPLKSMTDDNDAKVGVVLVKNINAQWGKEETLKDVSVTASPGQLIAVIGPVGSGKSSLLLAMLREMDLSSGTVEVHGKVGMVTQEPWLLSGSVRHNVLFGQPLHEARYHEALRVCALDHDLSRLKNGDATLVEALSGGQKARVSLARAIYADADIYLLDDPLSAVDSHVGQHLYRKCIRGHLKSKTCILVTHQLQYIQDADKIIILNKGKIEASGTYSELKASSVDFTKLLSAEDKDDTPTPDNCLQHTIIDDRAEGKLVVEKEQQSRGSVRGRVYLQYLSGGAGVAGICYLIGGFLFTEVLASGSDYWLSLWVNSGGGERLWYVLVLAVLMAALMCAAFLRALALFAMCVRASASLHQHMLRCMLGANMSYFYTNPSGRIMNHFSKDLSLVDEGLPHVIYSSAQIFLNSVGIVVVVAMTDVWLFLPAIVVAGLLYALRSFYLASSRSLKRLEAITRSPVLNQVKTSLQGLSTIRAFEAQRQLEEEFDAQQDINTSASYLFLSLDQAFGVWMDAGCLFYLTMVTFSFLVIGKDWHGGDVGLAVALSVRLTGMIQYGIRQWANLETNMTSVERLINFTKIRQEPMLEFPSGALPPNGWPQFGAVEFRNVSLRYRSDGPHALKHVSFLAEAGAKVGVVGRTGAGKTSLLAALLLLADDVSGSVLVDGVEVASLARRSFRARLGVITQDLFCSGTVRRILDVKGTIPDSDLWTAVEEVRMKDHVNNLDISSNWSAGQKQLLAVAREILRHNKIIILDEATSSVDPETDSFIHEMMRSKLQHSTVLTIAHRLKTVIDYDKIMVIDDGTIKEYDTPYCLLQNSNGYLYKMVEKLGRPTLEQFIEIAKKKSMEKEKEKQQCVLLCKTLSSPQYDE